MPEPIRVAYLIVDLEIGGAQRVLERLVTHLDAKRFHAIVVSLKAEGPLVHAFVQKGVRVVCLRMRGPRDALSLLGLVEILRDFRPHVLHTFMFHANVVGRVCGRVAGVPHIITSIHGMETRFYHLPLERLTWRFSDRVLFVADAIRRWAARAAGIQGAGTDVVYNGVPEPIATRPGIRTELGIQRARVVATAGRLVPRKGMRTFLQTAAILAPKFPDVTFVVLGGGELDGVLRELSRQLGIESRVHFAGWRDDVTRALVGAEAFVYASRYGEGLPTVVVEAMMAGVPVVATDVAGTREAVVDGETGILLGTRTPQTVADAVASLLSDPARARAMGEKGRERARERFSVEAMVDTMTRLYESFARRR